MKQRKKDGEGAKNNDSQEAEKNAQFWQIKQLINANYGDKEITTAAATAAATEKNKNNTMYTKGTTEENR